MLWTTRALTYTLQIARQGSHNRLRWVQSNIPDRVVNVWWRVAVGRRQERDARSMRAGCCDGYGIRKAAAHIRLSLSAFLTPTHWLTLPIDNTIVMSIARTDHRWTSCPVQWPCRHWVGRNRTCQQSDPRPWRTDHWKSDFIIESTAY